MLLFSWLHVFHHKRSRRLRWWDLYFIARRGLRFFVLMAEYFAGKLYLFGLFRDVFGRRGRWSGLFCRRPLVRYVIL